MPAPAEPVSLRFRQGAGRSCLDFVRTLRHRGTPDAVEELPDGEALLAWVTQCGPCADVRPGKSTAQEARELREAVHELIAAARAGEKPSAHSRTAVNEAAARPAPVPHLNPDGALHWHADDPVRATLSLVARDALDLVTSPAITRVRNCAGSTCAALFLDTSRPGTRRWCSMGTCGNRAKKETLRSKAAAD
ncbi:CGNR zinc finger domain-containing protein [Streptomyces fulvoviolaceus]|uniref:CGNR zinc finger domain-containing protein n=1 Tax=Streptomyces fulvoviolaceus TaxID=285535 RepID=UPI0004C6D6EB|nr:CGNR zinc finger domain-containing protein [Streptomyces fulvoviolaceus]MCT9080412.1 ABATE domain-containing protein [Streptomyces fulvoviolaceus]